MSSIYDKIDWPLLAKQKELLLEQIEGERGSMPEHPLDGLVSLIDTIQDEASELGYPVKFLDEPELHGFAVIHRDAGALPGSFPECFMCQAEDGDHAEEQCRNAYPESKVLWTHLGTAEAAYDNYWRAGK